MNLTVNNCDRIKKDFWSIKVVGNVQNQADYLVYRPDSYSAGITTRSYSSEFFHT